MLLENNNKNLQSSPKRIESGPNNPFGGPNNLPNFHESPQNLT